MLKFLKKTGFKWPYSFERFYRTAFGYKQMDYYAFMRAGESFSKMAEMEYCICLDYSMPSLNKLESLFEKIIIIKRPWRRRKLLVELACYIGEVFKKNGGALWIPTSKSPNGKTDSKSPFILRIRNSFLNIIDKVINAYEKKESFNAVNRELRDIEKKSKLFIELEITTLGEKQSNMILDFAIQKGVNSFNYDCIYSNKKEMKCCDALYSRLEPYRINTGHYSFGKGSIEVLKSLPNGILQENYNAPLGFENLLLFKNGQLFFEGINHENIGILWLNQPELDEFEKLKIPYAISHQKGT